MIPASLFKKKIAKNVNDIVQDKKASEQFLDRIQKIKSDRRKRNVQTMVKNSLNPNKELIDFRKSNINDLYKENKGRKEEEKQEQFKLKR